MISKDIHIIQEDDHENIYKYKISHFIYYQHYKTLVYRFSTCLCRSQKLRQRTVSANGDISWKNAWMRLC